MQYLLSPSVMVHSALNDDVAGIGQDREFLLSMNTLVSQWLLPLHHLLKRKSSDYQRDFIIKIIQIIPLRNITN